mmetsp:Transcript_56411/g.121943  ORF Transcript_56411/g.121943 Transcript_56411/m.121943 type:complete len:446 (-) Transcript_56411:15-1352(-)
MKRLCASLWPLLGIQALLRGLWRSNCGRASVTLHCRSSSSSFRGHLGPRCAARSLGAQAPEVLNTSPEEFVPGIRLDRVEQLLAIRMPGHLAHALKRLPEMEQLTYPGKRNRGLRVVLNERNEGIISSLLLLKPGVDRDALPQHVQEQIEAAGGDLVPHTLRLSYENLGYREALRQLLPEGVDVPSRYETVGHIAHFNLQEQQWPHRHIIGRVCLDKNPLLRTAVAKVGEVYGRFRTFEMEVISGSNETYVALKEHGLRLEFDYSSVYWNSRLSTERRRILSQVSPEDEVVDLFAGVGALALLCARQGCRVRANDLNPEAAVAIRRNAALNGLELEVSCADATEVLQGVLQGRRAPMASRRHLVMNLPEGALELLGSLWPLAIASDAAYGELAMHVYCFARSVDDVLPRLESCLGAVPDGTVVHLVRDVATSKYMFCVEFTIRSP